MMRFQAKMIRTLLVVLLALALGLVGYGHRLILPDAPDLSAFAMPDGTLPALCLDGGQDDQRQTVQAPCPACVISAGLQIPPMVALPVVVLSGEIIEWPAPAAVHGHAHPVRAPPARGPPSIFLI